VKRGLASFGSVREFHEFVLAGNEEELETFYESARHQPVLGSEEFRTRLLGQLGAISHEHVRRERIAVRPSVSRVVQAVATSYGGASWACAQIRRRRAAERGFRMQLKQIEKQIL